jgi:dipeptidyl aminopeptidase/acylaminoacyl peptidase
MKVRILVALASLGPSVAVAQGAAAPPRPSAAPAPAARPASRRPLTQADYDIWKSVVGTTLSRDGRWLGYSLSPQVGDGELVIRATRGATEYRVPRGFVGRPVTVASTNAPDSGFSAPASVFSHDGRVVAALTYPTRAEFERGRRSRRPADQPRSALAIVALADGRVTSVPRVRSFAMPRAAGGWLAYLLEPADSAGRADRAAADSTAAAPPAQVPGAAAATPGGTPRPISTDTTRRVGGRRPESGSTLVVRDLASGAETRIEDVTAFAFSDSARWLAYTTASRAPARTGAFVRGLGTQGLGPEVALASGRGSYRGLTFDRAGRQVLFVSDRDEATQPKPRFALYHARLGGAGSAARALVSATAVGRDTIVSERGATFSRDGSAILFGVAVAPLDSIPADSLADKAVFDLWSYKDTRLQPQQKLDAARDRTRAYQAVYTLATGRWVRLASDSLPQVVVSDDARQALAVTNVPYALNTLWGDGSSDVYLLDARTGARRTVAERVPFRAELSPAGRYVVWFADKRWHAYDTRSGRTADLTGTLKGVRFDDETTDTPSEPGPWGVAGWLPGDRAMIVNARYDLWELDPAGVRPARVVTDSVGAREKLQFRLATGSGRGGRGGAAGGDDRFLDPTRPLLLSAFDAKTKAAGFYRDRLGVVSAPEKIVMEDKRFGTPLRAEDAEVYAVTRQDVDEAPDVWVGERLDALTKVTDANPQQAQYAWPTAELFSWTNDDGLPLQGIVFKPADYDPSKKYPAVVYYYESLSDNLHQYHAPAGRNVVNPTVYASHGYVVFFPDIAYTTGYPGQSALKSIVPAIHSLADKGIIDLKRVGIAGQSWGGYQSAYIITQTPLFAAAFLGAPVANMTSAYGGIRWESGNARVQQYERGQSRIGGSLWQSTMRYIENSPLFYVDRVKTPVLIMANDGDGAVPWYQGIELFVGLKRFGKEAYLVDYNNDAHNPRKRANQLDVDKRMQEFFAHHLKGQPAPAWMEKGIPFLQKGRDQLAPPVPVTGNAAATQSTMPD